MAKCTCGKQLVTLSNGYTLCRECVDRRDAMRVELTTLRTDNKRYRDALEPLLKRYVDLANSGDAGFWDPECEKEVILARTALKESQ